MVKCARKNCQSEARFIPILNLRPYKNAIAASSEVNDLRVCPFHMEETTIDDIFSEAAWAKIRAKFKQLGYAEPLKEFSSLTFKQIKIGA